MRTGTPSITAVERTLGLLELIVADAGRGSVSQLATVADLPLATAHRQVKTLVDAGYLMRIAKGRHVAGPQLIELGRAVDPLATLGHAARPALSKLATATKGAGHLGVLEQDMVTYLVKTGPAGDELFTREGKQLEAYCSGIGKVLLAHLPEAEQERYLADGPFTPLTERTITDPERLRDELRRTRERGFAIDDGEVATSVRCVAVPLIWPDGSARAAISLSRVGASLNADNIERLADTMRVMADRLVATVFP